MAAGAPRAPMEPSPNLNAASVALAAGFATLSAAFTAIGAASGGVERMFRNHPLQAKIAVLLVAASLIVAILSYLVPSRLVTTWMLVGGCSCLPPGSPGA